MEAGLPHLEYCYTPRYVIYHGNKQALHGYRTVDNRMRALCPNHYTIVSWHHRRNLKVNT